MQPMKTSATSKVPCWVPPDNISDQVVEKFRNFVNGKANLEIQDYDMLHDFSVQHRNSFWLLLWEFLDIKCSVPPSKIFDENISIDKFPEFFQDSRLNYAENVLSKRGSGIAIQSFSEAQGPGVTSSLSWDELRDRTHRTAIALKHAGICKNDVVAYVGANTPIPVIVQLSTASIGALFTSLAGDMGTKAILDRLLQVQPKAIFVDNGYQYNGKAHDCRPRAIEFCQVLQREAGLRVVVLVENLPKSSLQSSQTGADWPSLDEFLSSAPPAELVYEQVPFNHPFLILFSSGTTGAPKGMIHSHGGPLINLKKEHVLQVNLREEDTYYHYTNIGWTMWNIFLGGLLAGATLILYDGSPFYPSPAEHLASVVSLGTTVFGGSPRYYTELRDRGVDPSTLFNPKQVRQLHSTGAVLPVQIWQWMSDAFCKPSIVSFSGGTEVCGSFVHGIQVKSQYAGEITVKALGVDADVWDEDGRSCKPGVAGELVIKSAFPNSATAFWNDPEKGRYRNAYFEQYSGVWTQGDLVKISPDTGGIIMLGRSDGVLNPSGVRFGSSEIYSVMSRFDRVIADSLCVGQNCVDQSEQVLLFIQLRPGQHFDIILDKQIQAAIAGRLSRRHVPKYVLPVPKIPYNVNGKKLEILVKRVVSGGSFDARIRTTLVNEDDLDGFKQFAKLGGWEEKLKSSL